MKSRVEFIFDEKVAVCGRAGIEKRVNLRLNEFDKK